MDRFQKKDLKKLFLKHEGLIKAIIITGFIILSGVFYLIQNNKKSIKADFGNNDCIEISSKAVSDIHSDNQKEETFSEKIYVYVCGNVNKPDVYELNLGSRMFEVIELAGGFTDNADYSSLNLAMVLKDGMRLYVPAIGENSDSQSIIEDSDDNKLVNINNADISELMTLPGVGEAKAKDIITYREKNGSFKRIEDIMNISGIKEAAFEKLKDYICV